MIKLLLNFLRNTIFSLFQFLTFLSITTFQLVYNPKVVRPKDLNVPRGTIIVANHQIWIDPWFIGYFMGFFNCLSLLPMRFPVTPSLYRRPVLGSILWLLGGFDIGVTPMERAKGLLFIRQLLNEGYTVLIFPEGQRNADNAKIGFQKGIEILAQENSPILLARLENMKNIASLKFWKSDIKLTYSGIIRDKPPQYKSKAIKDFFHWHENL